MKIIRKGKMNNIKNENVTMNGQENWSCGMQLRWVVGTPESGPAKVYGSAGQCEYDGSYGGAVAWLKARGCRALS